MNSSKRQHLTDLPECIYYSFRNYLIQDDYQQLLNTSKQKLIHHIRRRTIIFRLTMKYSIKYCEDKTFRDQLLQKVENPLKQVIITLKYSKIKSHEDLFDLFPIHLICIDFPRSNPNVKEFTFYRYELDLTNLYNIRQCEKATFKLCQGITDISQLKDCEHVTFEDCGNISDFSSLGRQRSLCIKSNAHLTNVMSFHSIRTIILEDCRNLKDVSPLHGVYDLSLIMCVEVRDISSLGGHHRLEISSCSPLFFGYHALKDIPIVKLTYSTISEVSVLSNSKVVYLEECESLMDVSSLRRVRELSLISCRQVEDISMLTTVQKLTLYNLPQLKYYEGINQMMNLTLPISLNDGMIERFPNVKMIECSFFHFDKLLPLLPSFTNLHSLTVSYISPVKIEICVAIHTVIFEHCTVKNISGLGKNRVVRLFQCLGDTVDVSSLATVPFVSIIKCRFKKMNYESLINVPRLKIDEYV